MKNIITDMQISKRWQGRINVFLDHRYAFTADLIDAGSLSIGQTLDPELVIRMQRKHENHSAYICAIRYLGHRMRSQKELDRYLGGRKGYPPETIATVINRLISERYLDDRVFAALFVESRSRSRPRSCALLRHELFQKGIDVGVVDEVLKELDDEQLAWRSIEGKLKQWDRLDRADFKKKILGFLQRRGFSFALAMNTYRRADSLSTRIR